MDQQNAAPESASKSEPSAESVPDAIASESAPPTPAAAPEPVSSGGRAWHAVKWMLAMVGVFMLHITLQVAVSFVAVIVCMVAVELAGGDVEATYNDAVMVTIAITQVVALAIFYPWWRRIRAGSFVGRRAGASPAHASAAKTAAILLFVGVAAQFFVSTVLGYVELFFPEPMAEYTEMMEDVGGFTAIATLSTVVLAPISEELVCRGIMLEYALRAVSPAWGPAERARRIGLSSRAFWIAAVLQAIAFGVLHMNWIQGSYAFALGVVEAWVFWRTGRPRYPILLHLALNGSSALVDPLAPLVNSLPAPLVLVVTGALLVGSIKMFDRAWPASDALEPVAPESDAAAAAAIEASPSRETPLAAVSADPADRASTDGRPVPPEGLSS